MKKLYSLVAVAALAFTVNAQQTNLVQNPGFESGVLAPWVAGWNNGATAPLIKNDGAKEGTYYAHYDATATTGFTQDVKINPNTLYTVSFWYKSTGDDSDSRLWAGYKDSAEKPITLSIKAEDDPLRTNNGWLVTSEGWKQHIVEFTSHADAAYFQFHVRAYGGGKVSFDDMSLVEGKLSTVDFSTQKRSLVKFAQVTDQVVFAKDSDVKIINMNGQVVKAAKVSEGTSLNVSSLAPGMYVVTGTVNGEAVSQKIIKK